MALRHALTDDQWEILRPLLPPEKRTTAGRPATSHRRILNAILWLCRTGSPWRDLPSELGPWRTIATRFYRWQKDGTWHRIFAKLRELADARGLIDWDMHCVDSSVIRAHQHAAGGKKGLLARLGAAEGALEPRCICELIVAATPSRSSSRVAKRTTRRSSYG
jgi:transposase